MKHIVFVAAHFANKQYPLYYTAWATHFVQAFVQHNKQLTITVISNNQNAITIALQPYCSIHITEAAIGNNSKTVWQQVLLPLALKKLNTHVVVHLFNTQLAGSILQFAIHPFTQLPIAKKLNANHHIVGFHQPAQQIVQYYPIAAFAPIQQTSAVNNITQGNAYFVAFVQYAQVEKITQLLKAFSLFKKRLLSNMYLLLIDETDTAKPAIELLLCSYKYKSSVLLLHESMPNAANFIAYAYASMYMDSADTLQWPLLQSMQLQVPCLVLETEHNKAIAKDAALYTTDTVEMIAGQLIAIYKNEQQRQQICNACAVQAKQYTPLQTVQQLLHVLEPKLCSRTAKD
jgi:hypothetical protein